MDGMIEVGKADGDVRLWRAVEAMRQGELLLATQTANLVAMETRATAILAWSVAGATAIGLGVANGTLQPLHGLVGLPLLLAAGACILAMWPRRWHGAGYHSRDVAEVHGDTELEVREAIALGYDCGIARNGRRLRATAVWLRGAWLAAVAAPLGAIIGWWVVAAGV